RLSAAAARRMPVAVVDDEFADRLAGLRDAGAAWPCHHRHHDGIAGRGVAGGHLLARRLDHSRSDDAFARRAGPSHGATLSVDGGRLNVTLIDVESAVKRYGPVIAVDGVSLSIQAGEIYSLVGANGAGKSTLIRMIMGLTAPDAGRVLICGEDHAHHAA